MATCKECLHFEACSTIYEKAFREKPEKYTFLSACPLFKAKANYEEVKRGRWIVHHNGRGVCVTHWAECSECHTEGSPQWKRCPVCEAKMDLE